MLYTIGAIGTIFILGYFVYDIIQNIVKYRASKKYNLSTAFLKLTILWFSMTISIFPFRYFIIYIF